MMDRYGRPPGDWPTIIGTTFGGLALIVSVITYAFPRSGSNEPTSRSAAPSPTPTAVANAGTDQAQLATADATLAFLAGIGFVLLVVMAAGFYRTLQPRRWHFLLMWIGSLLWVIFSWPHMRWYVVGMTVFALLIINTVVLLKQWDYTDGSTFRIRRYWI
jgi:hypothetical protein